MMAEDGKERLLEDCRTRARVGKMIRSASLKIVRSIRNVRDAIPSATAASPSRVVVLIRSVKLRCASSLQEICAPNLY